MIADVEMPSLEAVLARAIPPKQHASDVIVLINGYQVWKSRADLTGGEHVVAFFSGDYRDVLEQDDVRLGTRIDKAR